MDVWLRGVFHPEFCRVGVKSLVPYDWHQFQWPWMTLNDSNAPETHHFSCTGCFKKSWNIFTSVKSFSWNFANLLAVHVHMYLPMTLFFPRVSIVFTLSSFEYSTRKWNCRAPAFLKRRHFSSSRVLVLITVWFFYY